jgi:hypothetical protein
MTLNRIIALLIILFTGSPIISWAQTFTKVTAPNNPINTVPLSGFYRGCAWVDLDNDGDLDLSTVGYAWRNESQDSFSIIQSFGNPVNAENHTLGGVSWADYDNDGDEDCLYSFTHNPSGTFTGNTIIYENDGDGEFTEKLIDENQNLRTWSAAFGASNADAYIDITCAVAFNFAGLSTAGFYYTGNADGTFTKVDTIEFAQNTAPYTVAYWTDYDQDGDQDLLMASGPGGGAGPDFHYRNLQSENNNEGLVRIGDEPFATTNQDGQCYNIIDYDLDGDQDLYLTNYGGAPNRFYENQNGTLTPVSNNLVFGGPMLGNCWGDFDNDGDQDVILTSDNLSLAGYFENQDGVFEKISNPFPANFANGNVSGLTIGDYDGDGDLDFFANGGVSGSSGPRALFKNELDNENHWIQFDMQGANNSNRSALGTQVRVKATINGTDIWLHREVSAQNTFMGHNARRIHFGLGSTTTIDSMVITWPSGNTEVLTNIGVDTRYTVLESPFVNSDHEPDIRQGILEISPNPTQDICTLNLPEIANPYDSQLSIYNHSGQIVLLQKANQHSKTLHLNRLPSGQYFIHWRTGAEVYLGQVLIQR